MGRRLLPPQISSSVFHSWPAACAPETKRQQRGHTLFNIQFRTFIILNTAQRDTTPSHTQLLPSLSQLPGTPWAIDHLGTKELRWKEKAPNYILCLLYRKFIPVSLIERMEEKKRLEQLVFHCPRFNVIAFNCLKKSSGIKITWCLGGGGGCF